MRIFNCKLPNECRIVLDHYAYFMKLITKLNKIYVDITVIKISSKIYFL